VNCCRRHCCDTNWCARFISEKKLAADENHGTENQGIRSQTGLPGTDVMIFKIFSQEFLAKILAFFAQATAIFGERIDNNIVFFRKPPIFFAEN
jgi:limonene-1,2-epoxide hydrolase